MSTKHYRHWFNLVGIKTLVVKQSFHSMQPTKGRVLCCDIRGHSRTDMSGHSIQLCQLSFSVGRISLLTCLLCVSCKINMEGRNGQKEHFLILINDLLILINELLILRNHLLILINHFLILINHLLILENHLLILINHFLILINHLLI